MVLEVPGGMMEVQGETPEQAASRELIEETGYSPEECIYLGAVHPNPAIQNNLCHTFFAKNARPVQTQRLEGTEDIEVIEIPLREIPKKIQNGEITHALVLIAFFWYQRYLDASSPPRFKNPLKYPSK
jgi:8-oxo-dGTP pyrophosphatase MutT (NUDIX family)